VSARQVLESAGVRVSRQPAWAGLTPSAFWHEVNAKVGNGIIPEGRRRILAAAAAIYPANPFFRAAGDPSTDGTSGAAANFDPGGGASYGMDIRNCQGVVNYPQGPTVFYFGSFPAAADADS
jgi:hypothetical protein